MTEAEKDTRILELEQTIKDIASALLWAPDSAYWSAELARLLGDKSAVDRLHDRLREENRRGASRVRCEIESYIHKCRMEAP